MKMMLKQPPNLFMLMVSTLVFAVVDSVFPVVFWLVITHDSRNCGYCVVVQ